MPILPETAKRYAEIASDLGYDAAAEKLGMSKESLRRYVRLHKKHTGESEKGFDSKLMRQLQERFTQAELQRLLSSSHFSNEGKAARHDFDGNKYTLGYFTDPHLGSIYTDTNMVYQMFDMFRKRKVHSLAVSGDIFEGLSHRPGHCYECSHLGYSAQLQHGREVFGQWTDTPVDIIDGNHDRWYIKSNGAVICEELARSLDNVNFLGHDEGDISINGITVKLFHGEDGSSYAYSYRIQKLVEAITGGKKPNCLLAGHTHKSIYMFDRNIHCVQGGSIQKQSKWMRAKRQASHTGFWIIDMVIANKEIKSFRPEWFPYYK